MMSAITSSELRLRDEIAIALQTEQRRIDREIKELRASRRELKKIVDRARTVARRAYLLQDIRGEEAAQKFSLMQKEAIYLRHRILDLRGSCDLYRELDRHVDLWVTLKPYEAVGT